MTIDSPAAILYDNQGNPVGISFDGSSYRLKIDSLSNITSTAIRTIVVSSSVDTFLIGSNIFRRGIIFYNNSDSPIHIGFGTSPVTLNDASIILAAHCSYELLVNYTGEVRGIWEVATGDLRITELT